MSTLIPISITRSIYTNALYTMYATKLIQICASMRLGVKCNIGLISRFDFPLRVVQSVHVAINIVKLDVLIKV